MGGLLGALRFLTRISIPGTDVPYHRSVRWLPVAGAVIGLSVGGLAWLLAGVLPPSLAAALAVVTGVMITGAFHEDGLGDVADAFGGGWTLERRMEILKDSRQGTYGVAAIACSILIRVLAAQAIAVVADGRAALLVGFVAAHALGRSAAVGLLGTVRPATLASHGLGVEAGVALSPTSALLAAGGGVAATAVVAGWWTVPLVATAVLGAAVVAALAVRKIGGLVGDVLGAAEQVVECLVLVVVSGLASQYQVWWV